MFLRKVIPTVKSTARDNPDDRHRKQNVLSIYTQRSVKVLPTQLM